MKKFYEIALLAAFSCSGVSLNFAQSVVKISGAVYSEQGTPLPGANVIVVGAGVGAATDLAGHFVIKNLFVGEFELEASFIGYQSMRKTGVVVDRSRPVQVNFSLPLASVYLEKVVVEAEQTPAELGGFSEVISRHEIEESAAATVGEILLHVPGINIIEEGGSSARKRISIRGSNANQVVVLLDGVALNDPLTGEVDLNQISLSMVETISVSKGGSSSLHGNGAIGGVVEIFSRKRWLDEVRLKTQAGGFAALGLQPTVSGHFKNVGFFLTGEYLREQGDFSYNFRTAEGALSKDRRMNADLSAFSYFAKSTYAQGPHQIQAQANIYSSTRGLPGLLFSLTPFARVKSARHVLVGNYQYVNNNWRLQLNLSQHKSSSDFRNAPPVNAPLRFRTVPPYHTKNAVLSHRLSLEGGSQIARKHDFQFTAMARVDAFRDNDFLALQTNRKRATTNRNFGAGLRARWILPVPSLLNEVSLTSAVRFDSFVFEHFSSGKRSDLLLSPQVGLDLSGKGPGVFRFRANYGRSFRMPTFADLFFQDFRVRGNPDLLPEKSWDFDAGIEAGVPLFAWAKISATYFRHRIDNLIVWELGSFATWQPSNTDALLRGWEFGGSLDFLADKLKFETSHVLLMAVDKSGRRTTHNKALAYRPKHSTRLGSRLSLGWFSLLYNKRLTGRRFVTAANTVEQPGYSTDDLSLLGHFTWLGATATAKVSFLNLFDEKYEVIERAPMPGRSWRVALELSH